MNVEFEETLKRYYPKEWKRLEAERGRVIARWLKENAGSYPERVVDAFSKVERGKVIEIIMFLELMVRLKPEEQRKLEERLIGLKPEERLADLSEEEQEQLLKLLQKRLDKTK